ncbi:MAG TPA: CaiB/BaiF CoA-transferase family protein [Intrasporangium sp.]|uniref:CaiB/BaiF CoA transferase family protein n=1 Tax=Intrasporangium sp. TaxID=1925024 RepID=UPI002D781404|nr:CaiB/BaiF CoA-transferase family protein [Intrasporangium sp.]HET7399157.1 CaiB/BaiF CoA-transferase family protein [Intrasporangium sp.]
MSGQGPLTGVTVVELGGIGPAPFCAMVLADLGADVVRVQRPGASGAAANPVLDRGRRSITVDLRQEPGRALVRDLAARADALVEGFRPGVAERLGLGPADLHARNPRLVYGRMTGFGQDGPLAQRAGHDLNYIALTGALAAIGRPGSPPTPPLNLVADFGGGGMLLAVGVLAAVLSARTTGAGQVVDAAMVDGSALLMSMVYGLHAMGEWTVERGTNLLDGGCPFYDVYACADGAHQAVGALEPQFFAELVRVLGVQDEVDLTRQYDRETWPHQRAVISRAFAARPRDEWTELFTDVDACVTPVLTMAEAPTHPHNVARGTLPRDGHGVVQPAPAPRFSRTPAAPPRAAAAPGAHTDELLAGLGLSAQQIAQLRAAGVVA